MKVNVASRLSTDTPDINSLVQTVDTGEIKVPQFQRKFVWKEEQALDLLDSIATNYPIGSLLLWRTNDKLATERNIGEFKLPATDDLSPTDYVLDGQQRLTVIYSCLGAQQGTDGFAAVYDLKQERFDVEPTDRKVHQFPLRWLYRTTDLLNFRTALQTDEEASVLQSRLDALVHVFHGYKIPVVTLKDLTVEEVCPIFERINSSGTRLSTFDLMVAATWSKDFDLNERVERIAVNLEPKGFDDIEGNTVLKCLAAVQKRSIKREDTLSLRKLNAAEMDGLVAQTEAAVLHAIDALITEFKVYALDFLPYEAQLVVLTYIFSKTGPLSDEQVRRVRQWFWRTSISERYRGASEHFVSRDLQTIHDYVVEGKERAGGFGVVPDQAELLTFVFRKNNSRSRAFASLLRRVAPTI